MRNRQFVFTPKIEYELVAERSEAGSSCLLFPELCRIMKIVRTVFAPKNSERRSRKISKPPKSSEKQSARTMF